MLRNERCFETRRSEGAATLLSMRAKRSLVGKTRHGLCSDLILRNANALACARLEDLILRSAHALACARLEGRGRPGSRDRATPSCPRSSRGQAFETRRSAFAATLLSMRAKRSPDGKMRRGLCSDLILRSAHALACARLEGRGRPGSRDRTTPHAPDQVGGRLSRRMRAKRLPHNGKTMREDILIGTGQPERRHR